MRFHLPPSRKNHRKAKKENSEAMHACEGKWEQQRRRRRRKERGYGTTGENEQWWKAKGNGEKRRRKSSASTVRFRSRRLRSGARSVRRSRGGRGEEKGEHTLEASGDGSEPRLSTKEVVVDVGEAVVREVVPPVQSQRRRQYSISVRLEESSARKERAAGKGKGGRGEKRGMAGEKEKEERSERTHVEVSP
jgi:hypothetical protein